MIYKQIDLYPFCEDSEMKKIAIIKKAKIRAHSKVEWDSTSGPKKGKVKQILGDRAAVVDSSGITHIVSISILKKRPYEI